MKMANEVEATARVKLNGADSTYCDYYAGQVLESTDTAGNRFLAYIKEIKSVKKVEDDYLHIHVIAVPIYMIGKNTSASKCRPKPVRPSPPKPPTMLNRVILRGRLASAPKLMHTSDGVAVAMFQLEVDRPFVNQRGNRDTDLINMVAWRKQAENVAKHMKEGHMVAAEGRLQVRSFRRNGRKVLVTEVVADSVRVLEEETTTKTEDQ